MIAVSPASGWGPVTTRFKPESYELWISHTTLNEIKGESGVGVALAFDC